MAWFRSWDLPEDFWMLIGARLAQGLGAALMVPTTLAIIVATFDDPRERTRAVGAGPRSARSPWLSARSSAGSSASTCTGAGSS
jgi:MFS family permease